MEGRLPRRPDVWCHSSADDTEKLSQNSGPRREEVLKGEMARKIEADYDQIHLLPAALEDWVGPEHPARFVREFVRALDLKELGFKEGKEGTEGRPRYSNELLLRLWLYGYLEKVRSTRKLERACRDQMGFVWLCGNQGPDHNSLWRFWQANREALRRVFKKTVKVAMELELVGLVLQALDGTKIQAVCSGRGHFDQKALQRLQAHLDEVLVQREAALEEAARQEDESIMAREAAALDRERLSAQAVRAALAKVEAGESRHIHPGEPEARRMESDGRNRFSYNAQAVVDHKERVIVAAEVCNAPEDFRALKPMLEKARENLGPAAMKLPPTSAVDGGYACGEDLQEAANAGHHVLSPMPAGMMNREQNPFHSSCFVHDSQADVVRCPQGRLLPFRRTRLRRRFLVREYRSATVCGNCPVRTACTRDRHGRSIEISPWEQTMQAHRQKMAQPLAAALLKMRSEIVEPVFGWIKAQWGFRRWSVRGLQNVSTQWALVCTAVNLRSIHRALLRT